MADRRGDIELMLRARDGDAGAFGKLVHRYREPLHRFYRALVDDPSRADDLELRALIAAGGGESELQRAVADRHGASLVAGLREKIRDGLTSVEEGARVLAEPGCRGLGFPEHLPTAVRNLRGTRSPPCPFALVAEIGSLSVGWKR